MKLNKIVASLTLLFSINSCFSCSNESNRVYEAFYFGSAFAISGINDTLTFNQNKFSRGIYLDENYVFNKDASISYSVEKNGSTICNVHAEKRNKHNEAELELKSNEENPNTYVVPDDCNYFILSSDDYSIVHSFCLIASENRTEDLIINFSNIHINNGGLAPAVINYSAYPVSIKCDDQTLLECGDLPSVEDINDNIGIRIGKAVASEIGTYSTVKKESIKAIANTILNGDPEYALSEAWTAQEQALQTFLDYVSNVFYGNNGNDGVDATVSTVFSFMPVTIYGTGNLQIIGATGGNGGKGQNALMDGGKGGAGGDGGAAINASMALIYNENGNINVKGGQGGQGGSSGSNIMGETTKNGKTGQTRNATITNFLFEY